MHKTSKTILFFGTENFSLTALEALVEAGFSIGAVITKPDARRGRSAHDTYPAIKQYALKHDIPVWQPARLSDITEDIKAFDSPAGVLVSYGKIIPQSVIDLFSPGIINVHPSLLPKYRGPTPIESAIINGDQETGISIMQLSAQMDAGPIYSQTRHSLLGTETKPELYDHLSMEGARELVRVLPAILEGALTPTPQEDTEASYCSLLSKDDSYVRPLDYTATAIERRIRAHLGFPKTRLPFYGKDLIVTKTHVTQTPDDYTIVCKDQTLLSVDTLVTPNGKMVQAIDYLRGLRTREMK